MVGSRLKHQGVEIGSLEENRQEEGTEDSVGEHRSEGMEGMERLGRQVEESFRVPVEALQEHQREAVAFLRFINTGFEILETIIDLPGKPGRGGGKPAAACWSIGFV